MTVQARRRSAIVTTPFQLQFEHGATATGVRLDHHGEIPAALSAVGLSAPRPVLVLVGGAGGLDDCDTEPLRAFSSGLVRAALRFGAAAIDGGTLSGVMRLLGEAHRAAHATTPLIGVAAAGTVALPGEPSPSSDAAPLEPRHTHFVLVPGREWGAESPWIARIATVLAGTQPSATVLVNGGEIAYDDVERSIDAGRPVVTVAGSGRTADQLAAAVHGDDADPRAVSLVASGLIRAVPLHDAEHGAGTFAELIGTAGR